MIIDGSKNQNSDKRKSLGLGFNLLSLGGIMTRKGRGKKKAISTSKEANAIYEAKCYTSYSLFACHINETSKP